VAYSKPDALSAGRASLALFSMFDKAARRGLKRFLGNGLRHPKELFSKAYSQSFVIIQPIDMLGFLLLNRVAHKLVYYLVAIVPFGLVFYLCRGFFPGWPAPEVMAAYIASLAMAFLLGFLLEATIGMIGFWFLAVNSLFFVYMLFNFFFSGHMFPIDLLPGVWGDLVKLMPLQYLAYFPAAVFLGKVSGPEVAHGLWVQFAWVVFFVITARVAFHYGVRRYSGFGG